MCRPALQFATMCAFTGGQHMSHILNQCMQAKSPIVGELEEELMRVQAGAAIRCHVHIHWRPAHELHTQTISACRQNRT